MEFEWSFGRLSSSRRTTQQEQQQKGRKEKREFYERRLRHDWHSTCHQARAKNLTSVAAFSHLNQSSWPNPNLSIWKRNGSCHLFLIDFVITKTTSKCWLILLWIKLELDWITKEFSTTVASKDYFLEEIFRKAISISSKTRHCTQKMWICHLKRHFATKE